MDLSCLVQILNKCHGLTAPISGGRSTMVMVPVFRPGTLGGTPAVAVTQVRSGIDWDNGKVFLETAEPLTTLTPEDVNAIRDSARKGQSWHAYQAHKAQAERITALEQALSGLIAAGTALAPDASPQGQAFSEALKSAQSLPIKNRPDSPSRKFEKNED